MAEGRALHEPFHHPERQADADRLGMLVFLASEAMLFGGIFATATALRFLHPSDYTAAAGHLKLWFGTANTVILLTSSLFAALAVAAARAKRPKATAAALWSAFALGLMFACVKGVEYYKDVSEGVVPGPSPTPDVGRVEQLVVNLYYAATGLHAFHLLAGMTLLAVAAIRVMVRHDPDEVLVGNVALYWHLVDVIWVFIYPTLYLARAA